MEEITRGIADSSSSQKKGAQYILATLYGEMPKNPAMAESVETNVPAIKITELALKEIVKSGGKVEASLIGMLSQASKLEDVLARLPQLLPGKEGEENREKHRSQAEIAAILADELVTHGLVELPVVGRGRGVGK